MDPSRQTAAEPSLLAGFIVDENGEPLTATHAVKNGVRYRYYVSQAILAEGKDAKIGSIRRLPAPPIEELVIDGVSELLSQPDRLDLGEADAERQHDFIIDAERAAQEWKLASPATRRLILLNVGTTVRIRPDEVQIDTGAELVRMINEMPDVNREASRADENRAPLQIRIPTKLQRVGQELRFVYRSRLQEAAADPSLVRLIVRARSMAKKIMADRTLTISDLARQEQISKSYATRVLRLAFLAPDIVAAILEGTQPVALTASKLISNTRLPIDWNDQRSKLGFRDAA